MGGLQVRRLEQGLDGGGVQGVYFAEFLLFGGMCAQLWKDGSQAEGCKKSSVWGGGGRVGGAVPALMSGLLPVFF